MKNTWIEKAKLLYTYAYPIVWTKQNLKLPKEGFLHTIHLRELAKADGLAYKPNNDTLYSMHALQLASTPFTMEIPKLSDDRYLLVDLLNLKTEVLFATGRKHENNGAGKYMLLYRDTEIPEGYEDYIPVRSDDSLNMLLIRTETYGEEDYPAARTVQDAFSIKPLYPERLKDTGTPITIPHILYVKQLSIADFLDEFLEVLPVTRIDEEIHTILKELHIDAPDYEYTKLPDEIKEALVQGSREAYEDIIHYNGPALESNGWKTYVDGVGTFEKDYLLRAFVSWFAWGANLPEDSVYPVLYNDIDGEKLSSEKEYRVHFKKDGLPHAKYFWSLSLYSEPSGTQVPNPDDKYVINSHGIGQLHFNEDGSLDILLSRTKPEKEEDAANWLPTPEKEDSFSLMLRMYGADEATLRGEWEFPGVISINQ